LEKKRNCPFDAKKVCPVTKKPVFMRACGHSDRPETLLNTAAKQAINTLHGSNDYDLSHKLTSHFEWCQFCF